VAKKLTDKQNQAVYRVANNLGISDQQARLVVSEYLGEVAKPAPKPTPGQEIANTKGAKKK